MDTSTNSTKQKPLNIDVEAGLTWTRKFAPEDIDVWDTVTWEFRNASIGDSSGNMVFEQNNVEFPTNWSMTATNVVVSKYFRGHLGTDGREKSIRELIGRVSDTITQWGTEDGYFDSTESAEAFRADLTWLCLHQYMAFNSPV
ncbi:MAG: vitamin B12-dependent ribonucleotide reductase, partial [Deltaproteobacteria bacterium]|nr:vitamin B12-dependent ribonucleotide reductase [Deltaproteobacteria bacterium]